MYLADLEFKKWTYVKLKQIHRTMINAFSAISFSEKTAHMLVTVYKRKKVKISCLHRCPKPSKSSDDCFQIVFN